MASNYNKRGAKELQRGAQNICFAQTLLCVLFLISVRSSFITTVLTERKENLMKMMANMPTQRRELLPRCRFLWVKRFFHEAFACFLCIPGILTYNQKFYASGKLKTRRCECGRLLTASCPGGICCL